MSTAELKAILHATRGKLDEIDARLRSGPIELGVAMSIIQIQQHLIREHLRSSEALAERLEDMREIEARLQRLEDIARAQKVVIN